MLEIHGVSKTFDSNPTLRNINLQVQDGEFLSLLGPSGCGKTTLLRIIAGLETPDIGKVVLGGEDVTPLPAHKRNVHTVFQKYALFPHMTIFDNVAYGPRCRKISENVIKTQVGEMLELAGLKGRECRNVTTLSGGEQQRVALVRALINMPKLLLLDEPLGALDAKLRLQLQSELVAIQKKVKTTFVFVTHDQEEALNMSDRIALMNKGEIVQLGTPQEIYENPKTFFAAGFIGSINKVDGRLVKTSENKWQVEVPELGGFFVEPSNGEFVEGASGSLCLRPEKIMAYHRKPSTVDNQLEGVVENVTYLGTHTQLRVQLKNGIQVSVFQQNSEKLTKKAFQIKDKVFLGWHSAMGKFFSKDSLNQ